MAQAVLHDEKTSLRERREATGLSREQLAVFAGVGLSTVLRTELGQTEPTIPTLRALAGVLDCDVADLLDENGNGAPQGAADQARREDRRDAATG